MSSLQELQALYQAGRIEECRSAALRSLQSSEEAERHAGALFLIGNVFFDLFPPALDALKPMLSRLEGDLNSCNTVAYAAWVTNDVALCRWASQRCIALNPQISNGYLRLGLLELGQGEGQYPHAFCALSAGLFHCPSDGSLQVWYKLAKALVQGVRRVRFKFDDLEFTFALALFNGQAMEMASRHVLGDLYEPEELRHARQLVGNCNTVVEVGALVGNHTLFFAKALRPQKIFVFDADALAVAQIKQNIALNDLPQGSLEIVVRHAAVGAKAGRARMFGQEIDVVRLDDEMKERVDFLKIDVDGMEMEVLDGCRGLIVRDRPKIMVEVQREFKARFHAFLDECGYRVEHELVRSTDSNFFIVPLVKLPAR